MSEMIGAQASLLQGLTGAAGIAGLAGAAGAVGTSGVADGTFAEGGFSAVLGAVMADQSRDGAAAMTGSSGAADMAAADGGAGVSGQAVSENAVSGAAVPGETVSVKGVSSGMVSGDITGAVKAEDMGDGSEPGNDISGAEALYGLLDGDISPEDGALTMEQLFTVFTGNAPKADIFTARGAGAFVSAVRRFFSPAEDKKDGNVSPMELLAFWQGVSADEKSAYADILSAIAGKAGVPGDEGILPAGELLSFAVKATACNAASLPLDRKKQEKAEVTDNADRTVAAYLAAAFIVPGLSMQSAADIRPAASEDMAVSGATLEAVPGEVIADMAAVSGSNAGEAAVSEENGNAAVNITENANAAAEELSAADSEDIREFCHMLAGELKAAVENEAVPESKVTPADISRQAFMARVSDPNAASFEPVSGRLSQGMPTDNAQGASKSDDKAFVSDRAADIFMQGDMAAVGDMAYTGIVREDIPAGETDIPETVNAYDANALADRIVYKVSGLSADGEESITLRLSPEELGEIKVTVSRRAGETSVEFVARKTESAAVIGDRAAALADALVSKGISLREISVSDMGRNATSEGGRSGQEMSYQSGQQAGGDEGGQRYSRHFYYGDEADVQPEGAQDPYYDKEANLWLKV